MAAAEVIIAKSSKVGTESDPDAADMAETAKRNRHNIFRTIKNWAESQPEHVRLFLLGGT